MGRSWKLGTAFGIGLYVHWSFLLAPALVLMNNWDRGLEAAALAVGVILAVFGCVLLHELGHALMARRFGIDTRDITLYPIGGVARLERMSDSPGEELAIAVAGPAVNVVIAAGLYAGMALAGIAPSLALMQYGSFGDLFLINLFAANIALVVFNMIPAFPMDGGRVLRSLLALGMPRLRATELAVKVGMVFSVLFIFGGLFLLGSPMLSLVGLFVFLAGQQELAMVRYQAYARYRQQGHSGGERQEPVTVLPVDHLEPSAYPAQPDFSGFTWDRRAGVWIEWRNGRPVGACSVGGAGPVW
jgi:Zn-dependent protease